MNNPPQVPQFPQTPPTPPGQPRHPGQQFNAPVQPFSPPIQAGANVQSASSQSTMPLNALQGCCAIGIVVITALLNSLPWVELKERYGIFFFDVTILGWGDIEIHGSQILVDKFTRESGGDIDSAAAMMFSTTAFAVVLMSLGALFLFISAKNASGNILLLCGTGLQSLYALGFIALWGTSMSEADASGSTGLTAAAILSLLIASGSTVAAFFFLKKADQWRKSSQPQQNNQHFQPPLQQLPLEPQRQWSQQPHAHLAPPQAPHQFPQQAGRPGPLPQPGPQWQPKQSGQ